MKPARPLAPSIPYLFLALLIGVALLLPWTIWRLVKKIFGLEMEG